MNQDFRKYEDAYTAYSDILSGRAPDRINPTITIVDGVFRLWWSPKT